VVLKPKGPAPHAAILRNLKIMKVYNKTLRDYQDIDWHKCHDELLTYQQQLVQAHVAKEVRRVKNLQRQIVTRFAARALAVRRVTINKEGQTPGVDGVKWLTPKCRLAAIGELLYLTQNPQLYRAQPVRRVGIVGIPKPGKA
jgi:RNA-directed DNA polymerase